MAQKSDNGNHAATPRRAPKPSPGPWRVNRDREIEASDGTIICWGYHEDMGALLDKIEPANARLIAAAPELLEALELAELWTMRVTDELLDGEGCRHEYTENRKFVRAAIAKAKGD